MQTLTNEQMKRNAPAIFSGRHKGSELYTHIPTIEVIEILRQDGWGVVEASQRNCRLKENVATARHLVRLQREDAPIAPQIVVMNAHDTHTKLQIMGGFFRFVCANGLIVGSQTSSYTRRHTGEFDLESMVGEALGQLDVGGEEIEQMKETHLCPERRWHLASKCARHLGMGRSDRAILGLLAPQRAEDYGDDAWRVFNVVQENAMSGGVVISEGKSGRRRTTRRIRELGRQVEVNQFLWDLTRSVL